MSIFVIFKVSDPDGLGQAIVNAYPRDHLRIQQDEWLISAPVTAVELSNLLGITEGTNGSAIVFKMGAYYGRATNDIWDWIKTKSEAPA